MELRVLRYFLMVAREENITKAAQLLHVTQPTISRQLQQLEEELGVKLFHRSNYHIVLTEDGMLLKRRAQELLELADKTHQDFSHRRELRGEISIGCGETINMARLDDYMTSFRQQHPLVQFRIYTATADEVQDRIENGLLDMGLFLQPVAVQKYEYIPMPYRERWGAMVREDSPLAALDSLTGQDILPYPLLLPWREDVLGQLSQWLGPLYENIRIAGRFNLPVNAAILVKHHMGIALCYDIGTAFFPCLRMVPLAGGAENGAVLAWKKNQPRTPAVEQFIRDVQNAQKE